MNTDQAFSFQIRKDGSVDILHHGRLAATLRGQDASVFLADISSGEPADRLMAKLTGNYKRGNERLARQHPRNRRTT